MKKDQIPYRIILPHEEAPKAWYNVAADMKTLPGPPLNPVTKKPCSPDDLLQIFPAGVLEQEMQRVNQPLRFRQRQERRVHIRFVLQVGL